jgi:hypothetical protein
MDMGTGCRSIAAASTSCVDSTRAPGAMNTIRSRSRIYPIWIAVEGRVFVEAVLNISFIRILFAQSLVDLLHLLRPRTRILGRDNSTRECRVGGIERATPTTTIRLIWVSGTSKVCIGRWRLMAALDMMLWKMEGFTYRTLGTKLASSDGACNEPEALQLFRYKASATQQGQRMFKASTAQTGRRGKDQDVRLTMCMWIVGSHIYPSINNPAS